MNAIYAISPYTVNGQWVFDDSARELKAEPLVCGADMLCSVLFQKYGNFNLIFTDSGLPEFDFHLTRSSGSGEVEGGTWYKEAASGQDAWLCPALFKYFTVAPDNLYIKANSRQEDFKNEEKQITA